MNVDMHWSMVNLTCPITGVKIIQPVRLPLCDDVFDKIGVLKKIKGMYMKWCIQLYRASVIINYVCILTLSCTVSCVLCSIIP